MAEDAESRKSPKLDLDTIFVNEIGQFGKFQLRAFGLASILSIFVAWSSCEYMFTTARIPTRCRIPGCDNNVPGWSPQWLSNAIPATGATRFDNCHRFVNTSALLGRVENGTCSSTLFDNNTVQYCEEYVYENTNSVAYDFNLACDEWRRTLIGTVMSSGSFIGLLLTGYISDHWGRRVALTITAFNKAWIGVARYWVNTYIGFMMSEFIEALISSGCFTCAYILVLELLGKKHRVLGGAVMNTVYSIGQVTLGLIAWGVPNWRYLTLALYIPQLFTILFIWGIPESVRWYMSNGRFDDTEEFLKKAAKINGRQLSEKSLQAFKTVVEEAKIKASQEENTGKKPWPIVQVFQHKRILLRVLVLPIYWLTTLLIYFGLSINAVNMSGNIYLNYVAVSAVEIPGFWTVVFLIDRVGRKPVLITAFWVCALFQTTYIFMPADHFALSLTVYLVGKYSIAVVMTAIHIYTAELLPTKYRQILFSYSSLAGRVGCILSPLTPAVGAQWFAELPFALFAGLCLLSGALIFTTPETLGFKLPDTFEDAERIGQRKIDRHGT